MTFPPEHIVKHLEEDPDSWITTERMLSEDSQNAYVELAFTDPKNKMHDYDLVDDALLYYVHKDDCCNPLDREGLEAKFINKYRVETDPEGMNRAQIRIIKNNNK